MGLFCSPLSPMFRPPKPQERQQTTLLRKEGREICTKICRTAPITPGDALLRQLGLTMSRTLEQGGRFESGVEFESGFARKPLMPHFGFFVDRMRIPMRPPDLAGLKSDSGSICIPRP